MEVVVWDGPGFIFHSYQSDMVQLPDVWDIAGCKRLCFTLWSHAKRTNWLPRFILMNRGSIRDHMFTAGRLSKIFEFVSSNRLSPLFLGLSSFVVYCSAECVYLSAGSTIKGKLHVRGADNTGWPPAGDTLAEANLSQKQTVTQSPFRANILQISLQRLAGCTDFTNNHALLRIPHGENFRLCKLVCTSDQYLQPPNNDAADGSEQMMPHNKHAVPTKRHILSFGDEAAHSTFRKTHSPGGAESKIATSYGERTSNSPSFALLRTPFVHRQNRSKKRLMRC